MCNVKDNVASVKKYLKNLLNAIDDKNVLTKANEFSKLLKKNRVLFLANQYSQDFLDSVAFTNANDTLDSIEHVLQSVPTQKQIHATAKDKKVLHQQIKMIRKELAKGHHYVICTLTTSNKNLHVCGVYPVNAQLFKQVVKWTLKGLDIANQREIIR